ncbi:MAG: T9SS type A sorting domain-containing protein [Bacteroidota bacterium]
MKTVALLLFFAISLSSSAQLIVRPLFENTKSNQIKTAPRGRISPNSLPFWDDFSITEDGKPDPIRVWGTDTTRQWNDSLSVGVYVNATLAINPPTYRVITFDGLDDNGQFYGNETRLTDQLYSDTLNLSRYNEADDIYLSFYWQAGGNVERPDKDDSIRLQFYNLSNNTWETEWSMNGSQVEDFSLFEQVPIKLKQQWISDITIFRFESFGDQDGPFDAWHLDYIFLDKNRTEEEIDNGYDDAAFSNSITSFLDPYYSMPIHQFLGRTDSLANQQTSLSYLNELPIEVITRDSVLNRYGAEVTYQVKLLNNNELIVNDQRSAALLTNELDFIDITLGLTDTGEDSLFLDEQDFSSLEAFDSAIIETTVILQPNRIGSTPIDEEGVIDQSINNTIQNQYLLHDFYAYDDGTAEYAVGVNQRGDQVGVQFWVEEPDTLTQIDIYFPNIAPVSDGLSLTLRIFNNLDDLFPLHSEPITIATGPEINEFTSYLLRTPLIVSDTFFVTYEQDANQYIGIGFDRNNQEASRYIYENITDEWARNERIQGALMIRPIFKNVVDFTLSANDQINERIVYPNPTNGIIYISSKYQSIELRNISGQLLKTEGFKDFYDFSEYQGGLYLLTIIDNSETFTQKIILK